MDIDSNFFFQVVNPLVTLGVGCVAIWLYSKQQKDQKRNAARIVLAEIRYAQSKINKLKPVFDLRMIDNILTGNTWQQYASLFTSELNSDDMDFITNFYSKCVCLQRSLEELLPSKQYEYKSQAYHQMIARLCETHNNQTNSNLIKDSVQKFMEDSTLCFPNASVEVINRLVQDNQDITQTVVYQKLKQIAGLN